MTAKKIRIGCGAGFSGDRIEPAIVLATEAGLDYLVLECLAERTIALAQKRKMQQPDKGYDPLLERRIESLLPLLVQNKICLITNMGAANPLAAARVVQDLARRAGVTVKVAAVHGDDVNHILQEQDYTARVLENNRSLHEYDVVSANAYLGTEGIMAALREDAQIIITGRVADPSLFLAPMMHAFGWQENDYDLLGKGTVIGHLLECAGQVSGGYFADPVKKPVPGLAQLGHPFADVFPDGSAVISKVEGTGGLVNLQTVKEQLLYEVVNPHEYYTPDVIADFTTVQLQDLGNNRVKVSGGTGKEKPPTCKVSVGYKAFWLGEGEISYAGENALARASLAAEIVQTRLQGLVTEIRVDYMGLQSVHGTDFAHRSNPYEIRLRIAAKAGSMEAAALVGEEVEALYTNGPAGGAGVRKWTNEVIGIVSVLIDRKMALPQIDIL